MTTKASSVIFNNAVVAAYFQVHKGQCITTVLKLRHQFVFFPLSCKKQTNKKH